MELKGKVALVTGAGDGIGKAIALKFASEGAIVLVNDRNEEKALSTVREIGSKDGFAKEYIIDTSDSVKVSEMVDSSLREFGKIDILANNVGIGSLFVIEEMPANVWDDTLRITLSSAFYCCRAVAPNMIKRKEGKIITIASTAAVRMSTIAGVDYTAAKHGLIGLNHSLAFELAGYGINVNVINPGMTMTDRNRNYMTVEEIRQLEQDIPMGRFCRPEEIAETALFLASNRSKMITGQAITVDGGWTLGLASNYSNTMEKRINNSRTKAIERDLKNE